MHTVKLLTNLIEHHQLLAYGLIFLGLIIEGEFVLISTGILAHLGALNFSFALTFVLLGGLCKTFIGYYLGLVIHKRWNHTKLMQYIEKKVLNTMPNFKQKPFWSIFVSKFIMGVNHIVIIFSGYEKIPFKKFLKAELSSTILWAPGLLSLGYFFSYTALHVSHEITRFTLVVLFLIIAFVVFDKLIASLYAFFEEFYGNKK